MTLAELAAAARQFLMANLGSIPRRLTLFFPDGSDETAYYTLPRARAAEAPREGEHFVPDAFQTAILAALEGKALRTETLGTAVGDRSRLFRKPTGGLPELRAQGLVDHHSRLGYYRPDAPPPELS